MSTEPVVDLDFSVAWQGRRGDGRRVRHRRGDRVGVRRKGRQGRDPGPVAGCRHRAGAGTWQRSAAAFACDVSSPASVTAAVEQVREQFGRIDILVNSAGVAILAPAEELDLKAWEKTIAINLTGTFLMCQKVGSVMLEQGYGRVVNLASQAASVALTDHAAYCASKFGVLGLTKVIASEWAGRGDHRQHHQPHRRAHRPRPQGVGGGEG